MPEEVKPKLDDFTAKVVADPAKPEDTLLLQGFLGASSQPDHTRVYSDMTLTSYVDVANADIIHVEPLPKESSPLGGSYLWVKKEAEVVPAVPSGAVSAKAKFLQGPIAAQAGGVAQPQPTRPITIPLVACHPTIYVPACYATRFPIHCPTSPVVCDTIASGFGPCTIPDPTIYEQQGQQQQFQAAAAQPQVAIPYTGLCGTWYFTLAGYACQHRPHNTPNCPQVVQQPAAAVPGGFAAHAMQQPVAAPPLLPVSVQLSDCPTGVAGACRSVDICPTPACPTPRHICPSVNQYHCPSVAGYDCPSVNQYHCPSVNQYQCPSVAGYDCPSVNQYHCPSVNNYECPPATIHGIPCPPTPYVQHCPTPNHNCPITESGANCPRTVSVDCGTDAKILC